ncbi:MAG: DMT family transporter [Syntrophomonas sp.]
MENRSGYYKVSLAAILWGTIGIFTRWSGLPPLELAFYRVLIAGLALFFILPRGERLLIIHTRHSLLILLAGILFAIDILLFFYSIKLTSLSNAALPYNMQPVFMALLARLLLNEEMQARHIVSFIFAMVGVGVLLTPSLISISYADIAGICCALTGALLLAIIAIIARKINVESITFVYYQMLVATICLLPFVSITNVLDININTSVIILIIALVHTALAYILYYDGLKIIKIEHVVVLTYFTPLAAALTGSFLFQEAITLYTVVGGLIIITNGTMAVLKR